MPRAITDRSVRAALKTVIDPELSVNIVDLGLVYGIAVSGTSVRVTMTLTTPACPLAPVIIEQTRAAVMAIPHVRDVTIDLTFEPLWTPDRMNRDAVVAQLRKT